MCILNSKPYAAPTRGERKGEDIFGDDVIAVGTTVALYVANSMLSGPLSTAGTDLVAWLAAHADTIRILSATWGTAIEAWITPIMMRTREANTAACALLKHPD